MSTSTGTLQTTYPGQNRADKRTFNGRILLIIERSKPINEDDRLRTSIPANTIKASLSTDKHHSLPPEAFYLQKNNSCTPCVPMFGLNQVSSTPINLMRKVIEALSFGTLSRVTIRASLLSFIVKWRRTFILKKLDFSAQSAQSLPRHYLDFKCF